MPSPPTWPDGTTGPKNIGVGMGGHPSLSTTVPVLPRQVAEELAEALEEAIETAEEGWTYASDYFREKWGCEGQIDKARQALTTYHAHIGRNDG